MKHNYPILSLLFFPRSALLSLMIFKCSSEPNQYPKTFSMSLNTVIGVACTASFFLPIAVVVANGFHQHRSLAALSLNYFFTALYNAMSLEFIPASADVKMYAGIITNYIDVPLMLIALLFFCPGKQKQRVVYILTVSFLAYEAVATLVHGFSVAALAYIQTPGLIIVLGYALFLFIRQVKFSIMHGKNNGRMLMLAAIVFSYACYSLLCYFYYVQQTPFVTDTLLVYYIATILATLCMGIGLHLMRKRIKELDAARVTRKELAMFFGTAG